MLNWIITLDNKAELYFNSLSRPHWDTFFRWITEFGDFFIVGLICLYLVWFLWKRNRGLLKYLSLAVFINEATVYLAKNLFGRLRPFGALKYGEFGGSLPSGHSSIAILVYGYICYLLIRFHPRTVLRDIAIVLLSLFILLIGFSRLYLAVHYLTDVLAGYLLGGAILFYLVKFSEKGR